MLIVVRLILNSPSCGWPYKGRGVPDIKSSRHYSPLSHLISSTAMSCKGGYRLTDNTFKDTLFWHKIDWVHPILSFSKNDIARRGQRWRITYALPRSIKPQVAEAAHFGVSSYANLQDVPFESSALGGRRGRRITSAGR